MKKDHLSTILKLTVFILYCISVMSEDALECNLAASLCDQEGSKESAAAILWIKSYHGNTSLVNLEKGSVCELPNYPGTNETGTVVLALLTEHNDRPRIAACGSWTDEKDTQCYSLEDTTWRPMPAMVNSHCPTPFETRSHNLPGLGWFLFGQDSPCNYTGADLTSSLFTLDNEWVSLPDLGSPYTLGYPQGSCSVQLNSTHIFVSGGFNGNRLTDAYILDLTDFTWRSVGPMPEAKVNHGCVLLNQKGEIMLAGGWNDTSVAAVPTVHIYNPLTNEWRQDDDLPAGMYHGNPFVFHWHNAPMLLEAGSDKLWLMRSGGQGDNTWEVVANVSLGGQFSGKLDTAVFIPQGSIEC